MEQMNSHDTQPTEDEVILADEVEVIVDDVNAVAWHLIEIDNPPLYALLMQMQANVQELVDFKRELESQIESLMSDGSGGLLNMVMRMFKS